jgi:alkylhydroperoxidase family enzyme
MALDELAPEVHNMVMKWIAEGGDPNFSAHVRPSACAPAGFHHLLLASHAQGVAPPYGSRSSSACARGSTPAMDAYERGPFTEREQAAFRYADRMYADHHAVDDAMFAMLRDHFSEDEILELSWAIAEFIALGTIIRVFAIPHGATAAAE